MKNIRTWGLSAIAALLLVACGGGDPDVPGSGSPAGAPTAKGTFSAVVSFGDSLSDVGAYTPATVIPGTNPPVYIGGKFTTNSATGTIWVENLSTSLGLPITPAEVGFDGQSLKCPSAASPNPVIANSCTGYAQAGSRITDPNGIGHDPATGKGALTVPLVTQIANHLTKFTSFKDSDLIVVWSGHNDVLIQFETFAATAAQIQADAVAGKITADQANALLFNAQTVAQAAMKTAALELAADVRTQILAKGGKYVAVGTLLDIGVTPLGQGVPASARSVLTDLSSLFNLWLRDGLTGAPIQFIDTQSVLNEILANPAKFGFTNTTVPACDAAKISAITGGLVTDGKSLFCNSTVGAPFNGIRAGADATTWLFADTLHPTTGGHKAVSDAFAAQLKSFGWL